MNIIDDITSYASDLGSIYNQFKGGSNVATPAQVAPKQTMAPSDNSRLMWIGGAVVVVVLAVVLLTRKRGK